MGPAWFATREFRDYYSGIVSGSPVTSQQPIFVKRIAILTGSELRHTFFRKAVALAPGIEVACAYCEGLERSLESVVAATSDESQRRQAHVSARAQSEEDFFAAFVACAPDRSQPVHLPKGAINEPRRCAELQERNVELLAAYGCSLLREPLLSAFRQRMLNVHLGLSPYYRGSGTNFWALVNGEPEYVGATFMWLDAGIDTGEIVHQIRARVFPGDTPHQIGNRLIADMTLEYIELIRAVDDLRPMPQPPAPGDSSRLYLRKQFSEEATARLYEAFAGGLVERYLREQDERTVRVPLVVNPAVRRMDRT